MEARSMAPPTPPHLQSPAPTPTPSLFEPSTLKPTTNPHPIFSNHNSLTTHSPTPHQPCHSSPPPRTHPLAPLSTAQLPYPFTSHSSPLPLPSISNPQQLILSSPPHPPLTPPPLTRLHPLSSPSNCSPKPSFN